jgi:uncharacterized membrane protein YkvA (DUF1232 family)
MERAAGSPADPTVGPLWHLLPELLRMLAGVVRDPRVPPIAKVQASALVALGLSPIDAVPLLGTVGLIASVALATRTLVKHTDEEVLRAHWQGSDEGFRMMLVLVEAGVHPRRLAWHLLRPRGR